jgi:hypothetical protein
VLTTTVKLKSKIEFDATRGGRGWFAKPTTKFTTYIFGRNFEVTVV